MKKAKGKDLTETEKLQVKKLTDEIAANEKRINELQNKYDQELAKNEQLIAEKAVIRERKKASIEKKSLARKEKIETEIIDIKKQINKLGYRMNDITGVSAEASYLIGKLAVNYIKLGANTIDAIVKKIIVDFPYQCR